MSEPAQTTFTAPESGYYHGGTGLEPHLVRECVARGHRAPGASMLPSAGPVLEVQMESSDGNAVVAALGETETWEKDGTIYARAEWIELPVETGDV